MSRPALRDRLLAAWVTCGGLGYAPVASGTFGTLGGVAAAALIGQGAPGLYLPLLLAVGALATFGGAAAGRWAERRYGRKDPGEFVLDEVAGYCIAAAWPSYPGWEHLALAFFLFRVCDVVKPPPARRLEKLPGGWGIVLDDLAAGVWALALAAGCRLLFADSWPA